MFTFDIEWVALALGHVDAGVLERETKATTENRKKPTTPKLMRDRRKFLETSGID